MKFRREAKLSPTAPAPLARSQFNMIEIKIDRTLILLSILVIAGFLSVRCSAQSPPPSPPSGALATPAADTTGETKSKTSTKSAVLNAPGVNQDFYIRPSQRTRLNNFAFDALGPYPVVGSAVVGAINQLNDSPPEWNQGAAGYFKRFGSDFGIAGVSTATRYALAEAMKQDTLYYRCECAGIFPRTRHALFSTFTARRGGDGHTVFSLPSLIAPYAGTMLAVYAWYPGRYNAKDAFRMGNYSLLAYAGGNVSLEFFYSGPHSLLARMHLNNTHGAPDPGPNHPPQPPADTTPATGPKP